MVHEKQVLSWFMKRWSWIQWDKTLQCSVNICFVHQCSIDAIYPELHSRPFLGCLDFQSKCCWGKNSPLKTDLTPLCTEIYTWPARQDIHSAVTGGLQGYTAFKLRHLVTKHTWMTELSGAKNRIWRTLSYRLQSQHIWAKSHRCTFQEVKSVEKH